jgi:hypothetical protein
MAVCKKTRKFASEDSVRATEARGPGPVTEGLRHCLTEAVPECRTAAVRALTRHCDSVTVRGPRRGARGHPLGRTAAGGLRRLRPAPGLLSQAQPEGHCPPWHCRALGP